MNKLKIWILTKRINRLRQIGAIRTYHTNPQGISHNIDEMVRMGLSNNENHKLFILEQKIQKIKDESINV